AVSLGNRKLDLGREISEEVKSVKSLQLDNLPHCQLRARDHLRARALARELRWFRRISSTCLGCEGSGALCQVRLDYRAGHDSRISTRNAGAIGWKHPLRTDRRNRLDLSHQSGSGSHTDCGFA